MECARYLEAIHELADGTLGPIRRAELQLHLDDCDACRALADDLVRLRSLTASLDRPVPPNRVWLQIAGRLRHEGRVTAPVTVTGRVGRQAALLAIAAGLVIAVGASLMLLVPGFRASRQTPSPAGAVVGTPSQGNAATTEAVQSVETEFRLAEQHYQNAIAKLEQAAKSEEGAFDAQTAAMLQKNLQVIDHAIAESRAALRTEPQSAPARDSLFDALKRKVVMLQDTIALMNEMRKGDSAGAAQLIEGIKKS
ncbi:MAG: zf-HC2 domain-containing protein [Acidobacteria bacterium]|nr:zf-HC2 domain-containing protein [Acidobacteriota bacterium]MCA1650034.1 zf-HC2 domain-containing protein [Acidobacteriota bacterium]